MNNIYKHSERGFEKLTSVAIAILGNSITFFIALCLVIFWFSNKQFYMQDIHNIIGDVILGVAFLSLFIIQKSFNRFSASLHLKVNELVASHEPASNTVINTEQKTEYELNELSKEYVELAEQADKEEKKDLPGYPFYPDSEDIYNKNKEKKNIDPEDISKTKEASKNSKTEKNNE